jgi:uncharacterized membrane protein YjjP (DUF1212 family)
MEEEILTLASESEGLFYFVNTHRGRAATRESRDSPETPTTELGEFWTVEDSTRELFARLAAIEAAETIDKIDIERKPLYSPFTIMLFRIGSSAGACAFWFDGSWADIIVSGALAVMVAWIDSSPLLSKQERIIFESVASFIVGLVSGIISIQWPHQTCFGAMAISGVLDLLQGFRVVYSIIEIMSRHSVTGAADFLEGVFFTTLIAYFLRFGQYVSVEIMGQPDNDHYLQCTHGVSEWYVGSSWRSIIEMSSCGYSLTSLSTNSVNLKVVSPICTGCSNIMVRIVQSSLRGSPIHGCSRNHWLCCFVAILQGVCHEQLKQFSCRPLCHLLCWNNIAVHGSPSTWKHGRRPLRTSARGLFGHHCVQ